MRELNARVRAEGLSDDDAKQLPVHVDGTTLERMEISTWQTDAGPLDILTDIPARDGHRLHLEDLAPAAETLTGEGFALRVASLDHIIASKEWADRPKDREALGELRALRAGRPLHAEDLTRRTIDDAHPSPPQLESSEPITPSGPGQVPDGLENPGCEL